MRRLMAVSLSVALWMSAVGTLTAQTGGMGLSASGKADASGAAASAEAGASAQAGADAEGESEQEEGADEAQPAAQTDQETDTEAAQGEAEATTTDAATTNTADADMDAGTYSVRLRDLEQRVNELKEQIFRSKARLSLLAETVLQGVVAGAQARIVHENKMGNSFRLVKITYALDGAPIFQRADEEGELGDREEFDIYNGSIVPGEHTLTVQLEYRGHGYGIFSYLKGYRFKVSSSHTFTAPEGKATTLRVVGFEKGGPTAPLEERPAIRYVERVDTPVAPQAGEVAE